MDEDQDLLAEIEKKRKKKSFESVINKGKFSETELEEVMMEG